MLKYLKDLFNPKDILKTVVQTFTASVLIGSFLMVLSDFIVGTPDLTGRWELKLLPEKSSSKKTEVMKLEYTLLMKQSGLALSGMGEKTKAFIESGNKNNIEPFTEIYQPGDTARIRIELEGFIEKHYLRKYEIYFSYLEFGSRRESSTIAKLKFVDENYISGIYESTIGDTKGRIVINRTSNLEEL